MNENELIDAIQKLLDRRDGSLTVPRIERIKDVHQFMLEHYKGDMVDLRERMGAEAKQCRDIIKILQDEVGLKMNMIDKLRKDMRALIVEMQNPNVALRFLVNKEKIPLDNLDEFDLYEALDWHNENMSKVFFNTVFLASAVDYIRYLEAISELNIQSVEFYAGTFVSTFSSK